VHRCTGARVHGCCARVRGCTAVRVHGCCARVRGCRVARVIRAWRQGRGCLAGVSDRLRNVPSAVPDRAGAGDRRRPRRAPAQPFGSFACTDRALAMHSRLVRREPLSHQPVRSDPFARNTLARSLSTRLFCTQHLLHSVPLHPAHMHSGPGASALEHQHLNTVHLCTSTCVPVYLAPVHQHLCTCEPVHQHPCTCAPVHPCTR
jgi:hypothetical protein